MRELRIARIGDDGRSLAEITPNSCLWLEEAGGHSLTHSLLLAGI